MLLLLLLIDKESAKNAKLVVSEAESMTLKLPT
jgi:hypothetical protein